MAIELIWSGRHADAGWRDFTGVPAERWHEAIVPEDLVRCTQVLADVRRLGHPIGCDARIRASSGGARWFRVVFAPGGGEAWHACAHDIDERMWIATVSHELRTPLTTLLLWERVLRDSGVSPERHAEALDAIHDCALAQSRIVEDLVQLSRTASGTLRVEARPVDLGAVVRAAVAAAALAAMSRHITVTTDLGGELYPVRGDAQRLRQILDNVFLNSLKFSREGGTVAVTVRAADGVVRVVVRDDGEGISAELLPRVFEPFTGTSGGLGLGLAIARELAALHGGSVEAHSAGRGRGATFTLALPLAASGDVAIVAACAPTTLDGVRLVVVADDPRVRDALAILLDRAGAAAVVTTSAGDAAQAMAQAAPDVVVCDPAMPHVVVTANVPVIPMRRPCDLEVLISEIRAVVATPD